MELHSARRLLLLRVLIGCLVAVVAAAQTPTQLKVFRGTVVHSRVPTEMEVLEDYLIGFDESNYGTVSCRYRSWDIHNEGNRCAYIIAHCGQCSKTLDHMCKAILCFSRISCLVLKL